MQLAERPRSRAWFNAGSSIAARMAIIATTIRSSIRVNVCRFTPGYRRGRAETVRQSAAMRKAEFQSANTLPAMKIMGSVTRKIHIAGSGLQDG